MVRWRTFAGLAGLRRARSAPLGISPGISRVRGRQITPSMISAAPGSVTDRVAAERRESRGGQKGLALPLCPVLGRRAGSFQPFSHFEQFMNAGAAAAYLVERGMPSPTPAPPDC